MSNSDRSALVVGGTGFIGNNLLRQLVNNGFQTTAIAFDDRRQAERLAPVAGLNILSAVSSNPMDLDEAVSDQRFDYIINLASGGVGPEDRAAKTLEQGNLVFLTRLLEVFQVNPPKLFIHAGSWSQYAWPDNKTPISENHSQQYGAGYGGAKSIAERDGSACAARLGIAFVTLRLFHVYGPGEPEHRLTPYLISRMAAGNDAELSPGGQVRDFVFIDDVVDAFIAAMCSDQLVAGSAYNVCSAEPVSVRHVVETLAEIFDYPYDMLHFGALPARSDEAPWVVGDNALFEKATGWRPRHTLEEGIRKTVLISRTGDNIHV